MDCLQWLVFSYLHLALIFCKHVNAGFQRRTFARTINFQLATIWKIPRDLCHILWRLFTIARQFPTFWRQFVVIGNTSLSLTEYWRNRQTKLSETNLFYDCWFSIYFYSVSTNTYLRWISALLLQFFIGSDIFFLLGKLMSKAIKMCNCSLDVSRRPNPTGICWLMCVPPPHHHLPEHPDLSIARWREHPVDPPRSLWSPISPAPGQCWGDGQAGCW